MPNRPGCGTFIAMFIISLVVVGIIRTVQGIGPLTDGWALLVGAVLLTPVIYLIAVIPSLIGKLFAVALLFWLLVIGIPTVIWQFQSNGLLTGGGLIAFVYGPVLTLPPLLIALVVFNPALRMTVLRGLVMGGGGFVATAVLTVIVRGLQNLEPAWEPGVAILFGLLAGMGGFVTGVGLFDPRSLFAGEAGLPKAILMGIWGFLLGGLAVIVLRGLQSMDPLWDAQTGMVVIAFVMTGFFLWGMGAFDSRLSAHGEHAEEAHQSLATEAEQPGHILTTFLWQATVLTLGVLLVVGFVALSPGGPGLKVTDDPIGSPFMIGFFEVQLPFGGPVVMVSELVAFVGFLIFTLVSLAAFGGGMALLFYYLSKNIQEVKNTPPTPEELTPPEQVQALGRVSGSAADWVRRGLPKLLGQK